MSDENTQNIASNPLKGFFRNPGLYISLPSSGAFYEPGEIKFDRGEELAVYPMTAQDEMITRSPDALLNGDAVYKVIASCVPGIIYPTKLTAKDAQSLMIGIRCATYGDEQEINQTCPECRAESKYMMNLRDVIANIEPFTDNHEVKTSNGLKIVLTPVSYDSTLATSRYTFENASILASMANVADEDAVTQTERMETFRNAFAKMANLNLQIMLDSIKSITIHNASEETQETVVTDKEHITEFLTNCDAKTSQQIEQAIAEYNSTISTETLSATCGECSHDYETPLEFDPVSFFSGS
jgi:hypothetical protein